MKFQKRRPKHDRSQKALERHDKKKATDKLLEKSKITASFTFNFEKYDLALQNYFQMVFAKFNQVIKWSPENKELSLDEFYNLYKDTYSKTKELMLKVYDVSVTEEQENIVHLQCYKFYQILCNLIMISYLDSYIKSDLKEFDFTYKMKIKSDGIYEIEFYEVNKLMSNNMHLLQKEETQSCQSLENEKPSLEDV